MQIVQDLIARGDVKGIGISPANAAAMAVAAQAAKDAGIPLITWDSDLLPEDQGLRVAYIGTHNYEIGVNLAKRVQEIKPEGGTICIQSGGAAAANHNERMQGIRDTLAGVTGTTSSGQSAGRRERLDRGGGLPALHQRRLPARGAAVPGLHGSQPGPRRLRATGGFPQFVPDANRAAVEPYKGKIADGSLALVVADTLPIQIEQMKEGFSAGQVGQRPFEMGYQVMLAFQQMADGGAAPADPTYTGLDVCTPETADTCIAK